MPFLRVLWVWTAKKPNAGSDAIEYAKLVTVNENGGNEGEVNYSPSLTRLSDLLKSSHNTLP